MANPIALHRTSISEQHLQSPAWVGSAVCSLHYPCATAQAGVLPPPHAQAHCTLPHSLWGCGSTPTAPESTTRNLQHRALTLNGKTAKIPAEKAVSVVTSGWVYVEQRKKEMFSLQASQTSPSALPLPMRVCCLQPAHHLPRARGEAINSRRAAASFTKRMPWQSLTRHHYPSFTPLLTLAALPQLIILVLGKTARGRMPTTHWRKAQREAQIKD